MKAILNGQVIAESDDTVVVEGNHYFPATALDPATLRDSELMTSCYWKGTARYYDVTVDGESFANAVWYYPDPKTEAAHISGRVAFAAPVSVEA